MEMETGRSLQVMQVKERCPEVVEVSVLNIFLRYRYSPAKGLQ